IDLTIEILSEKGMTVDEEQFKQLMSEQKVRARAARGSCEAFGADADLLNDLPHSKDVFIGYNCTKAEAKVLAIVHDCDRVSTIIHGQEATIVLENTPFYAESGGQVGDTGMLSIGNNHFQVSNTQKLPSGYFAHTGKMIDGKLNEGDKVCAEVDDQRRKDIMRNHSACHLLQAALRTVLGSHVHQAGSMVDENHLRFDFTHYSAMTAEEINKTEALVNEMIFAALPVTIKEMPIAEAKTMGAMALFGEKYGDIVRVCKMGDSSTEFCGGTHVSNTSQIGVFKISGEASVAAGVRRIEATTAKGVLEMFANLNQTLYKIAEHLKVGNVAEIPQKIASFVAESKEKEHELATLKSQLATIKIEGLFSDAIEVGSLRCIIAGFTGTSPETLQLMADKVKEKAPVMVAMFSSVNGEKASIMIACGDEAVKAGVHAGKLVKQVTALCGGSGGGRPDRAMGGTTELFKIDEAAAQLPAMIKAMIKA
ncbi:MAG: alanine--tRNA ligase-related protein, partial [Oscillospiraceae bacterium]